MGAVTSTVRVFTSPFCDPTSASHHSIPATPTQVRQQRRCRQKARRQHCSDFAAVVVMALRWTMHSSTRGYRHPTPLPSHRPRTAVPWQSAQQAPPLPLRHTTAQGTQPQSESPSHLCTFGRARRVQRGIPHLVPRVDVSAPGDQDADFVPVRGQVQWRAREPVSRVHVRSRRNQHQRHLGVTCTVQRRPLHAAAARQNNPDNTPKSEIIR